jgi:PAS domain S-box-containing protein
MPDTDAMNPEQLRRELQQARTRIRELEDAAAGGNSCCAHYNSLFRDNHAVMLFIDPETGLIADANNAAANFYGWPRDELLGKPIADINTLPPDKIREEMRKARGQSKRYFDFRHRTADGDVRDVEVYSGPIRHDGRELLYSLVFDVTERKLNERLKEDMVRIARHDLKSPLNGVLNIPEVLLLDENLTEDQRQALKMIVDSGEAMLNLINMSQDFFRMEQGTYRFQPEPVDVREVLDRLVQDHAALAESKALSVHVVQDAGVAGLQAGGVRLLCYTLLGNLLKNALEAAPPASSVEARLSREGDALRVDIVNPGAVPRKVREAFFEKYATSGKQYGLGLGAYSAKLMAETMDGSVSMRTSDEENRTTLVVRLPLFRQG